MKKNAFTLIELIFVIVVLGILAAIALPRIGSSVESAYIATAQGDVAAIRSAIASARQKELVKGNNKYITVLSSGNSTLFDGNGSIPLLAYPIKAKSIGGWTKGAGESYTFTIDTGKSATFTYNSTTGKFDCTHTNIYCQRIAE